MNKSEQKGEKLIDELFRSTRERNLAKKIYYYRVWGLTMTKISEKIHMSYSTVRRYLRIIEENHGVIQTRNTQDMITNYLNRLDFLIKDTFDDLENAKSITERMRVRKLILDLLNAQADSIWRTKKQEVSTEKSPLAELREKLIPLIETYSNPDDID
jgi:DNA-binding transcriptional ArsR family regulator